MKQAVNISPVYTVFTPTFNRSHTLHRVFDSLVAQTCHDFEWIVIDDGSTDDTQLLVKAWQQQADFPIHYYYQINSGKHIAYNLAVKLAHGELFLVIDSDDGFVANSLESMLYWWQDIPSNQRDSFTGIVTLCQDEYGKLCGVPFAKNPLDTNALDLRYKHKIRAETWGFHRTDVLKQFPFPEDTHVRFIPENIVWDAIAHKYQIRCINEPLRIFYQDLTNRLTKADPRKKARVKNYFLQMLNRDFSYFLYDPVSFAKWAVLYVRYSFHANDAGFMKPSKFQHLGAYLLCLFAVPVGLIVYVNDNISSLKQS